MGDAPSCDEVAKEASTRVVLSADAALLDAITPKRSRWSGEATLQLAQTAAIIIGGLWAYHIYTTFQRRSNELALSAATAQQKRAELEHQQVELNVKKTQIEVDRVSQSPIVTTDKITLLPLSERQTYLARYDYSLTNAGNQTIRITSAVADIFLATPQPAASSAIVINDVGEPGMVNWKRVSLQGFVIADEWQPDIEVTSGTDAVDAQRGGGGTGTLAAGESTQIVVAAIVTGKSSDLVGFRIRFDVTDHDKKKTHHRLREYLPLGIPLAKP